MLHTIADEVAVVMVVGCEVERVVVMLRVVITLLLAEFELAAGVLAVVCRAVDMAEFAVDLVGRVVATTGIIGEVVDLMVLITTTGGGLVDMVLGEEVVVVVVVVVVDVVAVVLVVVVVVVIVVVVVVVVVVGTASLYCIL